MNRVEHFEKLAGDVFKMWPILEILKNDAGQPRHPTGGKGPTAASQVENALSTRQSIDRLEERLSALAAEAHIAHSGEEAHVPTVHPALVLHGLASWIMRQPFSHDMERELEKIHQTVAHIAGYAKDMSDAACPCCRIDLGQAAPHMLRSPAHTGLPDLYTCPLCGYAGIIERSGPWNNNNPVNTLQVTMRLRVQEALEASTEWVKPASAAKLVGIKTSTVRTWKQRNKLTVDDNGRVILGEVAKLANKKRG